MTRGPFEQPLEFQLRFANRCEEDRRHPVVPARVAVADALDLLFVHERMGRLAPGTSAWARDRADRVTTAVAAAVTAATAACLPAPDPDASSRDTLERLGRLLLPACHYQPCPEPGITGDHVIPRSWGGDRDARNIVPACRAHNSEKSDHAPTCGCVTCTRAVTDWVTGPGRHHPERLAELAKARPVRVLLTPALPVLPVAVAEAGAVCPFPAWVKPVTTMHDLHQQVA